MSNNLKHNQLSKAENNCNHDKGYNFTETEPKINILINILRDNLYGCDILLCLFIAALQSYRVDRCLRPFPTLYIKENNKDVTELRTICRTIPPLQNILQNPQICSDETIELLLWLFGQKDQPQLKSVSYNEVSAPSQIKHTFQPHHVFTIVYPEKGEAAWNKRKGSLNSFLSYHGSQLDNFYSILKVGLQQHFGVAKELLYGHGIYLTTEITVSMTYAPFCQSWVNSSLGSKHSIIAVCEVIDNVDKVKCNDKNFTKRAINNDSMSGSIPEKYFVVTDSDMVRVKYLFVYKEKTISSMTSWIYNNIALILIALYVMILFCIGFFQGPTWTRLQKQLYRMIYSEQIINDT